MYTCIFWIVNLEKNKHNNNFSYIAELIPMGLKGQKILIMWRTKNSFPGILWYSLGEQ